MNVLKSLRGKIGDLWWYSVLLFCAQRFGDVINMFVGLWLVPRYVPAEELGAVLPITQCVTFIGLPLSILSIPFMKYLGVYASRGELGKVKSLLRDVFIGAGILGVLTFIIAWAVFPFFFDRVRVVPGSLGILVILGSVLGAVSTLFYNAIQGLRLYGSFVWLNFCVAPVRLVSMLIAMPFRPLSGYFVGQTTPSLIPIVAALLSLRRKLGRDVVAKPYLREDGLEMLRYAIPVACWMAVGTISGSVDVFVIRHNLCDFESAGYYVLTRFTDIATYFGSAISLFLFPMVSGSESRSAESMRILRRALFGTLLTGVILSAAIHLAGPTVLSLISVCSRYAPLSDKMFPIALNSVLGTAFGCLVTFEMAQGRFRFLWYTIPIYALKCLILYSLTGISFFRGILPDAFVTSVETWNPCRLIVVISIMLIANAILLAAGVLDAFFGRSREGRTK